MRPTSTIFGVAAATGAVSAGEWLPATCGESDIFHIQPTNIPRQTNNADKA